MKKLIVVSGLPGTGKSTLSEGLSKELLLPIFSIDPIEASMWREGLSPENTGKAAYAIVETLADEHLKVGHSIIIDAVSAIEAPRVMWRNLAKKHDAQFLIVECICSDVSVHRNRVESRARNIEGMEELRWEYVEERKNEFEPWTDNHLTVDSIDSPSVVLEKVLEYVRS